MHTDYSWQQQDCDNGMQNIFLLCGINKKKEIISAHAE
jgi:hypothetical protein